MSEARVLVAYAGRGSAEVADTIAGTIRAEGLHVDLREVSAVVSLDPYEAVVIGSGVSLHRWRPEAVRFMRRMAPHLAVRDVWLFETDVSAKPHGMPWRIRRLADHLGFHGRREHFAGLSATDERVLAWARQIAREVRQTHRQLIG